MLRIVGEVLRVVGAATDGRSRMVLDEVDRSRTVGTFRREGDVRDSVEGRTRGASARERIDRSTTRREALVVSRLSVRPERAGSRTERRSRAFPSRVRVLESFRPEVGRAREREEKSRPTLRREARSRTDRARLTRSGFRSIEGRSSGWAACRLIRPKSTPDRPLRATSERRRFWSWSRRTTVRDFA